MGAAAELDDDEEENASDSEATGPNPFQVFPSPETDDHQRDDDAYYPIGWDLFRRSPQRIAGLLSKGIDPTIHSVILYRGPIASDGRIGQRVGGPYDPSTISRERIRAAFGSGIFVGWCTNARGQIVAKQQFPVGDVPAPGSQPFPGSPEHMETLNRQYAEAGVAGAGYQRPSRIGELRELLELVKMIQPQQPAHTDPLRDVIGAMGALVSMQVQQAKLSMTQERAAAKPQSDMMNLVLRYALEGRNVRSDAGGPDQFLKLLQFGMMLASKQGSEPDQWVELLGSTIDSIGPTAILALAGGLLPKDKFSAFSELVTTHMEARATEASKEPIDVDGEPVE